MTNRNHHNGQTNLFPRSSRRGRGQFWNHHHHPPMSLLFFRWVDWTFDAASGFVFISPESKLFSLSSLCFGMDGRLSPTPGYCRLVLVRVLETAYITSLCRLMKPARRSPLFGSRLLIYICRCRHVDNPDDHIVLVCCGLPPLTYLDLIWSSLGICSAYY